MSSEACYRRFESGELGDGGDFFEWIGLYENVLLYKKRIEMLEAAMKGWLNLHDSSESNVIEHDEITGLNALKTVISLIAGDNK